MTDVVEPNQAVAQDPPGLVDNGTDANPPERPGLLARVEWDIRHNPGRAEKWLCRAVVAACMFFVFWNLRPGLIFADNTPTGGDMGAHVLAPAFLRDHLLPKGQWSGWSPDWYSGFPLYQFYMVVPSLFIVLLDKVPFIPYGVAFKMIASAGPISLPLSAYAFGRLTRMRFPSPALLAVGTLPFLFDRGFTIYGGNIASTMAGEYNFAIALSLCLLYLGLLVRYLREGRGAWLVALTLAAVVCCHLIPSFYAVFGTLALLAVHRGRHALRAIPALAVGGLLTAWWTLPFWWRRKYTSDMGWEKKTDYFAQLFPGRMTWALLLAAIAVVVAFGRRDRAVTSLATAGLAVAAAFRWFQVPESRLWNARLLPFWWLAVYLLAALGALEVARAVAARWRREERWIVRATTPVAALGLAIVYTGLPMDSLPFASKKGNEVTWFGIGAKSSYLGYWINYNFKGYEGKEAYPEYAHLMDELGRVGREYGCGRSLWEYDAARTESYGTTLSMMLIPYWTGGCIASEEGLYFESSPLMPFHFLTASEAGKAPSRPVAALKDYWRDLDLNRAVEHMRTLGVNYYIADSAEAVAAAKAHPDLTLVGKAGVWSIFKIADTDLVVPLDYEPYVETGADATAKDWLRTGLATWDPVGDRRLYAAADGPPSWARIKTGDNLPVSKKLDPVAVSAITTATDRVSFHVDKVGIPVLVRTSYFPAWKATGAKGPYRVTPNLMVVVPTSNDVTLRYGRTGIDWVAIGLTLIGIAGLVVIARRERSVRRASSGALLDEVDGVPDPGDGPGRAVLHPGAEVVADLPPPVIG